MIPARRILSAAEETNRQLGHENLGFLSESHGFLPVEPPLQKLPSFYQVWDALAEGGKPRLHPDDSVENTREILTQARQRYFVAMIGPPPGNDPRHNGEIQRLSSRYEEVAKSLRIPYLDICGSLQDSGLWQEEMRNQKGSPGASGYGEWARLVREWPDFWHFLSRPKE